MKKIFLAFSCFCFAGMLTAQTTTPVKKQNKTVKAEKVASPTAVLVNQPAVPVESLSMKESEFDFGKIPQGKPVTHIFYFTNTGTTPFALDNVQASCGCTTPVWNKDVIAPGETAKITVGYNSANEGPFAKPVTITYNGNTTKQIIIKGEVWKTPVTSAPENTSVNSLKKEQ